MICSKCQQVYVTSQCWCQFDKEHEMKEPTDQEITDYYISIEGHVYQAIIKTVRHFLALAKQEPKMEWVLSFEEIDNHTGQEINERVLKSIINLARIGMIPAANAIQIPDESEWPDVAAYVELAYLRHGHIHFKAITEIPRSKPVWKPEEGKPVLFCDDDGRAMAGFIHDGKMFSRGLMCADLSRKQFRPFDPLKIGMEWDMI